MAKAKLVSFFCKECGAEFPKWNGQCASCKAWNSLVEAPKSAAPGKNIASSRTGINIPVLLNEVNTASEERFSTDIGELDRVLGGGVVPGSLTLVGGDPGIGKSTLLLQVSKNLAAKGTKVLYVSGEESLAQIRMRADRMGKFTGEMYLFSETNAELIRKHIEESQAKVVVIDSIQTMYSEHIEAAAGSISQVRELTNAFLMMAKSLNVSIFLVGHVTKEGVVAGPRMLEHMVDTVLYFEGERTAEYRILRAVKNRFGSTNEIGVFEMTEAGLVEVPNPSEYMLTGRPVGVSGSVVTCSMEGTRPLLLEIQALVSKSGYGQARRTTNGTDYNRVNLILAVLEKRLGVPLYQFDSYINITGGMKISEPALDLGIAAAVLSSLTDTALPEDTAVFGEIGLAGEIRSISMAGKRVNEAVKLGFKHIILPKSNVKTVTVPDHVKLSPIAHIAALGQILKGIE